MAQQAAVAATSFTYTTAPAAGNLHTMGFQFGWQMIFNQAPAGAIVHQRVEYTLKGFDKNGVLVHTAIFKADDLVLASDGVAGRPPYFFDTQNTMGIQLMLDDWAKKDGVCTFAFQRKGDMRVAMPADITIVTDISTGASRPYNPATDPQGMVFMVFIVDGVIKNQGGEGVPPGGTPPAVAIPNIGDRVRFTGTALYRAVWEETVNTTVVWSGVPPFRGPTYTIKGNIVWAQGIGGAAGAVGLPIFPEKPTFDVPTPWIDVTATTTRNVP